MASIKQWLSQNHRIVLGAAKAVQESTGKLESLSLHSTKLNFPIQPTAYSKDWSQMVSHGVPLFADRVGIQGLASLFSRLSDSFLSLRL